jgi:4-hydroxybenzoate polyprenyltransferase
VLSDAPSRSASSGPSATPRSTGPLLRGIIRELRPKQWLKNGLVFFALVYALQIGNLPLLYQALLAFAAFCAISSAGYLVNDLRDADLDRLHPTKRYRPIASGQISPTLALGLAVGLAVVGFTLAALVGPAFVAVCVAYVLITVTYSLWWKHVVLLDVFAISAGFVVRIVAGAIAVSVPVSPWLYVCTILGSLLIAFGKRRSEIVELDQAAEAHRPALEHYTVTFLDHLIVITATASVMAYSLYTFSAENVPRNHAMMATIPLVLYGVFRYLYLTMVKGLGGSPEELLLSDRSLAISVFLFLFVSAGILYLAPYLA